MGIDFYGYFQSKVKRINEIGDVPYEQWKQYKDSGETSEDCYIRESYHGVTHAIDIFAPETFSEDGNKLPEGVEVIYDRYYYIPSKLLETRMEAVKAACLQRAKDYGGTDPEINEYFTQHYEAFQKALDLVKAAEELGEKFYFYNSY